MKWAHAQDEASVETIHISLRGGKLNLVHILIEKDQWLTAKAMTHILSGSITSGDTILTVKSPADLSSVGCQPTAHKKAIDEKRASNRSFRQLGSRAWSIYLKFEQKMKLIFAGIILQANHDSSNGYQEMEAVQSQSKSRYAKRKRHGNCFLKILKVY